MNMSPPAFLNLNPFMSLSNCNINDPNTLVIPCDDLRRKIIALRVYFSLIIINFLFVVLTTCYFIYRNVTAKWYTPMPNATTSVSKMWQIYSLKKRGLFGTVLGAIGHLIFSSTVLLYQVFVSSYTCDIYLFGPLFGFYIWTYAMIWRTWRLHLMIRVNLLQQRFLEEKNPEQTEDYVWFQKHKDMLNLSTKIHVLVFMCTLSLVIVMIILAETLGIRKHGYSTCRFGYGNYVILAQIIFFFVVVVPWIFFYLRHDDDTHGIRREIWITLSVGVPCFIVFVIWQVLFESPTTAKPAGTRGVFGPANWIIIVTTANHVMTVISPVFKRLSFRRKKEPKRHSQCLSHSSTTQQQPTICDCGFELTTDCLEQALRDPNKRRILQVWAIKDFSVENILFYEKYLKLEKKIERRLDDDQHLLTTPFCPSDICDLMDFYNTFIMEQAPLQVNISYASRCEIDTALTPFKRFCKKSPLQQESTSSSGIPGFLQEYNNVDELHFKYDLLYSHVSVDLTELNKTDCDVKNVESSDMTLVTLETFESARKEIFWDIFSGLFPKVVAASD